MLQILSHSHQEKILLQWQKEHKWGAHSELNFVKDGVGQRLGVLGYGAIGRQSTRTSHHIFTNTCFHLKRANC